MKTWIFICMSIAMLLWFLSTLRRKPSQKKGCIDAIIPAYNWICPYISRHLLSLNPLLACCRRYSR
ncbi:hypothetical protein MZE22_08695, partial [Escherichia coli]|nr:hypothetical protein [Escherichia coli]MCK2524009.1 hypothetical protein [Escherichia coli]